MTSDMKVVDSFSYSQVHLRDAVREGNFNKVKMLVELGVGINIDIIPSDLLDNPDPRAYVYSRPGTVLHWAIQKRQFTILDFDLLQFLIERIQDINAHNNNPTLQPILHITIETESLEVV